MAPRADEGRGRRRNAPGSCEQAFDPEISEWGNPPGVMPRDGRLNQIGRYEETGGTETSKYPEEKRNIPLVVASESGGAQTVAA